MHARNIPEAIFEKKDIRIRNTRQTFQKYFSVEKIVNLNTENGNYELIF